MTELTLNEKVKLLAVELYKMALKDENIECDNVEAIIKNVIEVQEERNKIDVDKLEADNPSVKGRLFNIIDSECEMSNGRMCAYQHRLVFDISKMDEVSIKRLIDFCNKHSEIITRYEWYCGCFSYTCYREDVLKGIMRVISSFDAYLNIKDDYTEENLVTRFENELKYFRRIVA